MHLEILMAADIWSIGMTLFILLCPGLKYPFETEMEKRVFGGS